MQIYVVSFQTAPIQHYWLTISTAYKSKAENTQKSFLALKHVARVHCLLIPVFQSIATICNSGRGGRGRLCTPQLFAAFVSDRCCPQSTYLLAMRAQKGHCAYHWTGELVVLSPVRLSLLHKNFDSEQHPSCQLLVPCSISYSYPSVDFPLQSCYIDFTAVDCKNVV